MPRLAGLLLIALVAAAGGCGGDDEPPRAAGEVDDGVTRTIPPVPPPETLPEFEPPPEPKDTPAKDAPPVRALRERLEAAGYDPRTARTSESLGALGVDLQARYGDGGMVVYVHRTPESAREWADRLGGLEEDTPEKVEIEAIGRLMFLGTSEPKPFPRKELDRFIAAATGD